jgi:hypothetical protein
LLKERVTGTRLQEAFTLSGLSVIRGRFSVKQIPRTAGRCRPALTAIMLLESPR